jgi:hypothetical protein
MPFLVVTTNIPASPALQLNRMLRTMSNFSGNSKESEIGFNLNKCKQKKLFCVTFRFVTICRRFRPLPKLDFASVAIRRRQYVLAIWAQGDFGQPTLLLSAVWLENRSYRMWKLAEAVQVRKM